MSDRRKSAAHQCWQSTLPCLVSGLLPVTPAVTSHKSTLDYKGTAPRAWSSSDDGRRTRSTIALASNAVTGLSAGSCGTRGIRPMLKIRVAPNLVGGLVADDVQNAAVVGGAVGEEQILSLAAGQVVDVVVVENRLLWAIRASQPVAAREAAAGLEVGDTNTVRVAPGPFLHERGQCQRVVVVGSR